MLPRPVLLIFTRELRRGKRLFALSILTTMLATAMLTSVLGLGNSLRATLARDANVILGGDFELRISSRDFTTDELDWITANSTRTSQVSSVRAAAFTEELSSLMVIRAVDSSYPLFGTVEMDAGMEYGYDLLTQQLAGAVPVVISSDLGGALRLGVGDKFTVGAATAQVAGVATHIPDPSPTMLLNAPIVFMDRASLAATGLDQVGALRSERVKVDVGTADRQLWRAGLDAAFPDSPIRVRGTDRVVPGIEEMIDRMETMLLLVSLGTIFIAGICVNNTVSTYLRSRMTTIAVLKSLGMPASQIRAAYLAITLAFVFAGSLAGMPLGLVGEGVVVSVLSARLPFEVENVFSFTTMTIVPLTALLTAWIFAARPLHLFCAVSPTNLFSLSSGHAPHDEEVPVSSWRITALPSVALAALLVLIAGDRLFLLYFVIGGVAAAYVFRTLSRGMVALAARSSPKSTPAKIAMRAVARSGGQVSSATASLGVGLCALLTFSLTEANFDNQLRASLSNKIPEFYLLGMQAGDAARIREAGEEWLPGPDSLLELPMRRGSITHLNNVPVDEIDAPDDEDWVIEGDRRFTWAKDQTTQWTGASRVSEGEPWTADNEELLVSFDAESAGVFGLDIGDPVGIKINDVDYDLKIANLRRIDWTTFDVNFALVLSDGPWADDKHGFLGSVRDLQGDEHDFQRMVVGVAPNITPIRTKTVIESATGLLERIGVLLRMVTLTATFSGMLVLAAAIAEGRYRREHDSVILRILGTPHSTLITAFRYEFVAIALIAAVPALTLASIASYVITSQIFELQWQLDWANAGIVLLGTVLIVLLMGTASTLRMVRTPPLVMLRNE